VDRESGTLSVRSERKKVEKLEMDLAMERAIWCDKPEDRLYHAADRTWWRRAPSGDPVRAAPPPEVVRIAKALLTFSHSAVMDIGAYVEAKLVVEESERQ